MLDYSTPISFLLSVLTQSNSGSNTPWLQSTVGFSAGTAAKIDDLAEYTRYHGKTLTEAAILRAIPPKELEKFLRKTFGKRTRLPSDVSHQASGLFDKIKHLAATCPETRKYLVPLLKQAVASREYQGE